MTKGFRVAYNQYNITKKVNKIVMTSSPILAPIFCGTGINYDDPLDPVAVPTDRSPFQKSLMMVLRDTRTGDNMPLNEVITAISDFVETQDA
jgi:hypothetical protein